MIRHWPGGLLAATLALAMAMTAATATATTAQSGQKNAAANPAASKHPAGQSNTKSAAAQPEKPVQANHNAAKKHAAGPAKSQSSAAPGSKSSGFSYDRLVAMAKSRAARAYKAPAPIPKFLQNLGPGALAQIHYKRDDALWKAANLPFQVMFYHPGSFYTHAVKIHVINGNHVRPVVFDKNRFDYPNAELKKKVPDHLGYAGFKVLHELATPGKLDEVLSFLGASYFRGLGAHEHYGLSARGLAIDTGSSSGEEFPSFVEFWLLDPGKKAKKMTLYALLDSPSAAGAYKFVLKPGRATHTHVEATLFTRKAIAKLGVAPLTSMFTWGENSLTRLDNFRPEAHDSDGMLISSANGEWLWRPLVDPQKLWLNQFQAKNVRGFGLVQRDREFDHYQSLDYEYERRPNAWITPDGDWGDGHLELVEIPSDSEVNDNIVLYWVPKAAVKAGQRLHYAYDIKWSKQPAVPKSLGHVAASRIGLAAVTPGQPHDQIRVAIDFVGGELSKITDPNKIQPRVNAMRDATLTDIQAIRNPHTNGWRLTFLVPTKAASTPLELRAYLAGPNGGGLTETWSDALQAP